MYNAAQRALYAVRFFADDEPEADHVCLATFSERKL